MGGFGLIQIIHPSTHQVILCKIMIFSFYIRLSSHRRSIFTIYSSLSSNLSQSIMSFKSIFTVSTTYSPESTAVSSSDTPLYNAYRTKKPIVPYSPQEEYAILARGLSSEPDMERPTYVLTNVTHVPYKCSQWSNDRYKPVDTYSVAQHTTGFIPKPVSIETTKTDNEYNPRLSLGRFMYSYPILFQREQVVTPYPTSTSPLTLVSLKIMSSGTTQMHIELPPTITIIWQRLPRFTVDTSAKMQMSIDAVLDTDGTYLPSDTTRIPLWTDNPYIAMCDVWNIEDGSLPPTTQFQFTFRVD